MITVNVNNQNHSFKKPVNLDELLQHLGVTPNGTAIAVDNLIISRSKWQEFLLKEGCNVLVIKATQGG
ncbi:MAG: thiamine biosynthesis protein ThiS [Thalassobius sp.]|nr:thiamine biosynthesis protein ThiS [Thalassovita sp.]